MRPQARLGARGHCGAGSRAPDRFRRGAAGMRVMMCRHTAGIRCGRAVLRHEVVVGRKPAFKAVAVGAAQVEHLHRATIIGPAAGSQAAASCGRMPGPGARPARQRCSQCRPMSVFTSGSSPRTSSRVERGLRSGNAVSTNSPASGRLAPAFDQAARKPDPDALGGIGRGVVDGAGIGPFGGGVAGFFGQFTHGAGQRGLARVAFAGRQLQQHLGQWVAVLAHQHQAAIVQQGTTATAPPCWMNSRVAGCRRAGARSSRRTSRKPPLSSVCPPVRCSTQVGVGSPRVCLLRVAHDPGPQRFSWPGP
jgi:hypothetical protein